MKKIVISILLTLLIGTIIISITNIDIIKASNTTLADKVISLSQGSSWNSGASGVYQTNGHEYRYVGANVNNWVKFNNDEYRIIGVFDSNSTGTSGNLTKLIRARSIGAFTWGATNTAPAYTTLSTYSNNWETANVNILLNEFFLNAASTSTTYGQCSDWTYYDDGNDYKIKDCTKIVGYGIQTTSLRNYIQPVTWYLNGYSSTHSKQDFYTYERSDSIKVTNKSVGLMYVSDFLYASGYYSSTDTTTGDTDYYGIQNWLYQGNEWTITTQGGSDNKVLIVRFGGLYSTNTSYSYGIRPSFYLKEQVYVTGGDGSFNNPYTIACDTCNS